jgi:hypothetical protein
LVLELCNRVVDKAELKELRGVMTKLEVDIISYDLGLIDLFGDNNDYEMSVKIPLIPQGGVRNVVTSPMKVDSMARGLGAGVV